MVLGESIYKEGGKKPRNEILNYVSLHCFLIELVV